jgi:hypothetical protein
VAGITPTQLSLRHLRGLGWQCDVVERWVPGVNQRRDLFGFIDILAVRGPETLGVQTTTAHNVPARVRKISEAPTIGGLRVAGWSLHVHGWAKKGGHWVLARDVDVS